MAGKEEFPMMASDTLDNFSRIKIGLMAKDSQFQQTGPSIKETGVVVTRKAKGSKSLLMGPPTKENGRTMRWLARES